MRTMSEARQDRALILARGASRRMGRPKGLARLPGQGACFLEMILNAYSAYGIEVLVVAGSGGQEAYGEVIRSVGAGLLVADDAGDTARTVALGRRAFGAQATHLWAHPVDVPEVDPATLVGLGESSRREPTRAVRPVCEGTPGHPVVLPCALLDRIDERLGGEGLLAADGPMGEALRRLEEWNLPPVLSVAVDDAGVARDYDAPEDLRSAAEPGKDAPPTKGPR